jgi:nucleoside-diphosphate-sugar epimerase
MALLNWSDLHGNAFADRRCLVTGGAGFIGSHISRALLELGAEVVVLDDFSGSDRVAVDAMARDFAERVRVVEASVLNREKLDEAAAGCSLVFHEAAAVSVPESVEDPVRYHEVDATGTLHVLEAARGAGVDRVMFAASAAAYGDDPALPKREDMPPLPQSPYAAAKLASEMLLRSHASCYDLDAVSLRYFNVFGPGQNANSAYAAVIAAFASRLGRGEAPTIFGDGEQSRDFVFIDNVVHANLLAARHPDPLGGAVFNVACGTRISVKHLAVQMAEAFDRPDLQPRLAEERAGDVKHSQADIAAIREALGYEPVVGFDDGLRATVAWYAGQR